MKIASVKIVAAIFIASYAVLGCSFHPLYDSPDSEQTPSTGKQVPINLGKIVVPRIPNRSGQILRQALLMRLSPYGPSAKPLYKLNVSLSIGKGTLVQASDGSISRQSLRATASFQLTRIKDNTLELDSQKRVQLSFESSPKIATIYAETIRERSVQRHTLEKLAEIIVQRLAVHFANPVPIISQKSKEKKKE